MLHADRRLAVGLLSEPVVDRLQPSRDLDGLPAVVADLGEPELQVVGPGRRRYATARLVILVEDERGTRTAAAELDEQVLDPVEDLDRGGGIVDRGRQCSDRDVNEIRSANAGSWSIVRCRASMSTRRASLGAGAPVPPIRSVVIPVGTYCPTRGSASTNPPVFRASLSSAARSTAATTPGRPSWAMAAAGPFAGSKCAASGSPAAAGWTSSIAAFARRMTLRRMPPIWVRSNTRRTSATNPQSVTIRRTRPAMTVASGTASRPIAASANNAYVAVAVGSARPAMITGSRRRRAASRGEYELVWIWAAMNAPENVMPANAIIPAASAPKISCAALTLTGSRRPVRRNGGPAPGGRAPARSPPGSRRAPAPTSPTPARCVRGTGASGRPPDGRGGARVRAGHPADPAGNAGAPSGTPSAGGASGSPQRRRPRIGKQSVDKHGGADQRRCVDVVTWPPSLGERRDPPSTQRSCVDRKNASDTRWRRRARAVQHRHRETAHDQEHTKNSSNLRDGL